MKVKSVENKKEAERARKHACSAAQRSTHQRLDKSGDDSVGSHHVALDLPYCFTFAFLALNATIPSICGVRSDGYTLCVHRSIKYEIHDSDKTVRQRVVSDSAVTALTKTPPPPPVRVWGGHWMQDINTM